MNVVHGGGRPGGGTARTAGPVRRVAVTGVGVLTGLGEGRAETWRGLLDGRSAIGPVTAYDPASLATRLAAELPDFRAERYAPRKALRMTTRNDQLAIAGAALAVEDAALDLAEAGYDPERAGMFVGGNKEISRPEHLLNGSLAARREDGTADLRQLGERASSAFYPLYFVEGLQSASLFHLSHAHGFKGANCYYHGTADAGLTALGRAFRSIAGGESDVAVAGGFDDAASWWVMTKMDGLGVLTTRNAAGAAAFRPYDRERSGSVLGDGAAFLVLEEWEAASRRGARILAQVRGFGAAQDPELVTPHPAGEPLAAAVRTALRQARVAAGEVDYVAAHGCATRLGDVTEARALTRVFGADGGTAAGSVKPAAGHLVAGAGALNAAVCAMAIDSGALPPTLGLDDLDPQCAGMDWVAGSAREARVRHAVAIGRGLEGQQAALVLSAPGRQA
ncbi:beta-ketoacyl-[acyl-carrier-protein] synthase family protein [Streptomyces pactum]|uniref:Beta-ketoacyl-[acyl-carrier-protein] synthase family protein n=1 Tax=Streptomyces pactum TaxID=68249 RepID=A0ABS0NT66_9ACTN|nr:beta-ketoacyl-[acyl-carrier-protein] synthase family protein [Streptomyces pactum]MBH5338412.1 beta-ketoacyl-[acyl-carrier-protein] synthase family protein [Streptomyces pactum]